ncbi:hypothetical protein [Leifsonia sp. RAF41]|uniref:hypothetical protein n=1 Tax=Leifsonia sp. RAF41 TaxID=3233056 RepID=UPI003F9816A9
MHLKFLVPIATFAGVTVLALTGCTAPSDGAARDDGEHRVSIVYSAWVDGGDVKSVEYTHNTPADGALGQVDQPGTPTWSLTATVLHDRALTVTPTEGGIAHCLISSPSSKVVLAVKQGEAGAKATCDATITK